VNLRGEHVVLRPVTSDDIDSLESIFAEPTVAEWWPRYTRERLEAEFLRPDEGTTVYAITVDTEVAEVVGIIQSWEEDDPDYRHAAIDIAVAVRWHGEGVAVDALRTLGRHLLGAGHHRLVIDPAVANERAIACYAKVGFRPVGVMRRYERGADGTFHDSLLMDLLDGELR
jgi:aminoglycoside 6'-N-acetyltransferase